MFFAFCFDNFCQIVYFILFDFLFVIVSFETEEPEDIKLNWIRGREDLGKSRNGKEYDESTFYETFALKKQK